MSYGAFGAFAEGLAGGIKSRRDAKRRDEDNARMDRYLDIMEKRSTNEMGAIPSDYRGGGEGTASATSIGSGSGLIGLIDRAEGGGNYDTLFGHSQNGGRFNGVKVSDMTLAQLSDFSNPSGEYGQWVKSSLAASGQDPRVATPMGRYQIVGSTLKSATEAMGLSPDTKFTPQTQDAIASYLARNRLAGAKTPAAKRSAMRAEWDGFRNVPDDALDRAIAQFEADGGFLRPRPMGARQPV